MMPNNDNHRPHGSNQQRFAELLDRTSLAAYWDLDAGECDIERLKRDMGAWSHGERIMAQFLVAVWTGQNTLGFDVFDAAAVLDPELRAAVADWINDPFWP